MKNFEFGTIALICLVTLCDCEHEFDLLDVYHLLSGC